MNQTQGPDQLSLIVYSGDFAKVHYALVLAASAAAIDRPATLFFTMEACSALLKPNNDCVAAWRVLPAGNNSCTAGDRDDLFASEGLAAFEDLLSSCVSLGVRFLICEMGLRAMHLTRADLRDDLPLEEVGVVTLLTDASRDGAIVFI